MACACSGVNFVSCTPVNGSRPARPALRSTLTTRSNGPCPTTGASAPASSLVMSGPSGSVDCSGDWYAWTP